MFFSLANVVGSDVDDVAADGLSASQRQLEILELLVNGERLAFVD